MWEDDDLAGVAVESDGVAGLEIDLLGLAGAAQIVAHDVGGEFGELVGGVDVDGGDVHLQRGGQLVDGEERGHRVPVG